MSGTRLTGTISSSNSLVGSQANDRVGGYNLGDNFVTALTNGNYVVGSPYWDNGTVTDAGAVTWGDGSLSGTRLTGTISSSNSLVGSQVNDRVGSYSIGSNYYNNLTALTNGNYVVGSPYWDNGTVTNAGAVTWGDGSSNGTRLVGTISSTNSLVGSQANDQVGYFVTALTNGNYVVGSPYWSNGTAAAAGAVTWGDGSSTGTRLVGTISSSNSLVGSQTNDWVGSFFDRFGHYVTALSNGNYVVASASWHNGTVTDAGAVTWGDGSSTGTRLVGTVSSANSFVGSQAYDRVGFYQDYIYLTRTSAIIELTVGNMAGSFVVASDFWSNKTGRVDILTPVSLSDGYATAAGSDYTFTPSQLTDLLNTGTSVVLHANNDITVNSAITASNQNGNGGALSLYAGRSILLNGSITTDNGNMTLVANDNTSNGVVDAYRLTGPAAITMATGTAINAGTGNVSMDLRPGTGKTYFTSGDITLSNITAGLISAVNSGATAGSGITLNGVLSATGSGTAIELAGMEFINNSGSSALSTLNGRWLVWSLNPASDTIGGLAYDFKQYNANYGSSTVLGAGNGFLYTLAPVITVSLTGTVSKPYDSFRSATMLPANYSFVGDIPGDTVILNNPSAGTYDNKSVGTGKSITVGGVAIASASKGSVAVYGYQLASTSVNGNIGTIYPTANAGSISNEVMQNSWRTSFTLNDEQLLGETLKITYIPFSTVIL